MWIKPSEVEGVGVSYSGIEGQYYRCTGSNSITDTFPEMFYATLIKNYKISGINILTDTKTVFAYHISASYIRNAVNRLV